MPLKKKKKPSAKKRAVKKPARPKAVKKAVQRPVKKKTAAKRRPAAAKKPAEPVVGVVTHYFPHVNAAVIKMKKELAVNDMIRVKGHTTDFTQAATSIQINRQPVNIAKKGQEIGLQVVSRVRQHDRVLKI